MLPTCRGQTRGGNLSRGTTTGKLLFCHIFVRLVLAENMRCHATFTSYRCRGFPRPPAY